jgi:hypothetical protein
LNDAGVGGLEPRLREIPIDPLGVDIRLPQSEALPAASLNIWGR